MVKKFSLIFLLFINNAFAIDYSDALNHSREAFLIQSGIQTDIQKTGDYFASQIKQMGLDKELGAGIFAYKTYRDKACSIPIGHGKKLILNLNSMTIVIPF